MTDPLDAVSDLVDELARGKHLTAAERSEILRVARGYACKDSASAASLSPETIRARRKRIYRKLGVAGATEIASALLALALRRLAAPRAEAAREVLAADAARDASAADAAPSRAE